MVALSRGFWSVMAWRLRARVLWVKGPTQLDTPVLILGFEVEDFAAMMGVMLLSSLFFEGMAGVCVLTVSAGVLLKRLKRGRPPGRAGASGSRVGVGEDTWRDKAQGEAVFGQRFGGF